MRAAPSFFINAAGSMPTATATLPSSLVLPMISGTCASLPFWKLARIGCGSARSPTTNDGASDASGPTTVANASAGTARKSAALAFAPSSLTPVATFAAVARAFASVWLGMPYGLCAMPF